MDTAKIKNAMIELDEDTLTGLMREAVDRGGEDLTNAMTALQEGLQEVGIRFETNEYFIGDLLYAGEIMTSVMEFVAPALSGDNSEKIGKVLFCTVKDDLHDIGKNIVKAMLEANGFDVLDLGIDVPAEEIVDKVKENDIKIVALSGVLTLALDSMKKTVETFEQAGMRDKVKIIIGGAPVSEEACKIIGADDWAHSPQKTVKICQEWAAAV